MATELTQQLVKELFYYHKDGYLVWKVDRGVNKMIGKRAGTLNKHKKGDRWVISVDNIDYKAARLIFLWHYGWLPEIVDHENNITTDDKIGNLRDADLFKNARNKTSAEGSTSIYLGVCWWTLHKKWVATIRVDGKRKFLGYFNDEAPAALAYNKQAVKSYGEFANLNIIQP
jgi:hypothetical protein